MTVTIEPVPTAPRTEALRFARARRVADHRGWYLVSLAADAFGCLKLYRAGAWEALSLEECEEILFGHPCDR
ncbi:hypothetical protein JDV09_18935 [Mycobacterium sp. Y57]|uniref:hypothetical protein n=1 Tax=Mycolicibacterium xanthum TaxID=2796469 RepID=UPI001C84689C|nr:hypothetical protein [Mycolicibacterium xanthum]MBX7434175.1 hypothetical protein [Mycolicibacterium xanthum]